jgi:glycosyltransferase involved in cell wall biosynthesis
MNTKRLLAISWDMPPLSGPRAVQVSRTLNHLVRLGWESSVVCFGPRSARYNQDPELAARLRRTGVALVRVPSFEEHVVCRTLWRICPPVKLLPDEKSVWIRPASRAALRLAGERRFDALVSFGQPWSDHLIGLRVHRASGLPWLAHFSDPWTDSPYLRGRSWQRRIWRRMEADVVRAATALVFVNRQTAECVMRKYPDSWRAKVHVIPHGYDPGDARAAVSKPREGRLEIVYTGRFYEGIRTPEPMLRALAVLAAQRDLAQDLHVAFVGTAVPAYERLAASLGLKDVVEFAGRVSFAESARRAAAADVLLVIDAPADDSMFLPSKLVDYLPLQTPILGLTPVRGASADLIRSLGYDVVAPDDEGAISAAIETLIAAKRAGTLRASPSHGPAARRYDIGETALAFAEVLAQCA